MKELAAGKKAHRHHKTTAANTQLMWRSLTQFQVSRKALFFLKIQEKRRPLMGAAPEFYQNGRLPV